MIIPSDRRIVQNSTFVSRFRKTGCSIIKIPFRQKVRRSNLQEGKNRRPAAFEVTRNNVFEKRILEKARSYVFLEEKKANRSRNFHRQKRSSRTLCLFQSMAREESYLKLLCEFFGSALIGCGQDDCQMSFSFDQIRSLEGRYSNELMTQGQVDG